MDIAGRAMRMRREFIQELRGNSRKETIDNYDHIDLKELKEAYLACNRSWRYDHFLFRKDLKKAAYSSGVVPAFSMDSTVLGSFNIPSRT